MHDLVTEYKLHLEVKDLRTTVKYPEQGCAESCDRYPTHCFYLNIFLEKIIYANNILQMLKEMQKERNASNSLSLLKGVCGVQNPAVILHFITSNKAHIHICGKKLRGAVQLLDLEAVNKIWTRLQLLKFSASNPNCLQGQYFKLQISFLRFLLSLVYFFFFSPQRKG